jgi:hypothetical protein
MQAINQLARTPTENLRMSTVGYKVPDRYHPQRWGIKCGSHPTVLDQFRSDVHLRKALKLRMDYQMTITEESLPNTLSLVASQLARQFRPAFALHLYRQYCPPGGTVLDTCAGWGGRLAGFFASTAARYIGIDPSDLAHAGNSRMVEELCPEGKTVQLLHAAAEDVDPGGLAGCADMALTSPPYFDKEQYAPGETTQSHIRFPKVEAWRDGFLRPLLTLQYAAVKPGGWSLVNISAGEGLALDEWTVDAAVDAGFSFEGSTDYPLPQRPADWAPEEGEPRPQILEPVLIFRR